MTNPDPLSTIIGAQEVQRASQVDDGLIINLNQRHISELWRRGQSCASMSWGKHALNEICQADDLTDASFLSGYSKEPFLRIRLNALSTPETKCIGTPE